jgi:hypothetical protein
MGIAIEAGSEFGIGLTSGTEIRIVIRLASVTETEFVIGIGSRKGFGVGSEFGIGWNAEAIFCLNFEVN